ncbi:MAG: rhomboid family intramembrane serine protease, partial [Proteobacteria bacterium]|nr:rhomboid family intramembrane serine protease [Pseudomonadota bacterium]
AHLWGAAFGMLAVLLAVPGAASHFLRVLAHFGG